ncbi:MAG: GPW/gp25 family protein [Microscillaceae bacterium]|nr:GPW/gp25 family protein [Microscillaceae bacterium]
MEQNDNLPFLGKGWGFPPTFNWETNTVNMLEGLEDVKSSLDIILKTITGERVMQPTFGCNLQPFVFESMNVPTIALMERTIMEALINHEPRIIVEKISSEVFQLEGKVEFTVEYRVIITNTRYNYVFPFYIEEATNLVR